MPKESSQSSARENAKINAATGEGAVCQGSFYRLTHPTPHDQCPSAGHADQGQAQFFNQMVDDVQSGASWFCTSYAHSPSHPNCVCQATSLHAAMRSTRAHVHATRPQGIARRVVCEGCMLCFSTKSPLKPRSAMAIATKEV